jgi:hypothetical protein
MNISEKHRYLAIGVLALVVCAPEIAVGDAVTDWNGIMQTTVSAQPPFPQARFAAITQLAVFEAVNAITADYQPYLGTVSPSPGASLEAAAVAAAHRVLVTYFPAAAPTLDAARASSLAMIPDGSAKTAGVATGVAAADAVLAARAGDGSETPEFYLPASSNAGEWQVTPGCPAAGGAFLHWRKVKPFGLESADQFRLDAPPALNSPRYTRDYNEVKQVGTVNSTERPPDRADVARFYAAVTPTGVFNPAARQLIAAHGGTLAENARTFALLNMAISDGAVAVFDTKYHYNFWRPENAIRFTGDDGNGRTDPDPSYMPFIPCPCFPGFPSAHAALSGAAREVLERIFSTATESITLSNAAVPGITLNYTKLKQITEDIDDARVYGGIHYRFDQDEGARLGSKVGEYVFKNHLQPARGCVTNTGSRPIR